MSDNIGGAYFKVRDLKIYASKEWLADNKKKYRQVFDRSTTSYIYAELSFFNKQFDVSTWNFECVITAYNAEDEQVCEMVVSRAVNPDENVVYIREGWGMDLPGSFWKAGNYRWEVRIGSKLIASKAFYVVDEGPVTEADNPYLDLKQIRLYEADYNDAPASQRTYYRTFDRDHTRYIWVEFLADNLLEDESKWPCELHFNFYADTGQLKGQIQELIKVPPDDDEISCTVGWGSQKTGTWYHDDYKLEIVFMDRLIAVVPFTVSDNFEEVDETEDYLRQSETLLKRMLDIGPRRNLPGLPEAPAMQLDELIGLESIKQKVKDYTTYLEFLDLRRDKGIEDDQKINLHSVFIGNPGTGKTTIAKMLGRIYKDMDLLSIGHVHEVDRSDLVGEYIGQTAPKVKEAIEKARGGILFVDEAYALARKGDDTKDFGKEVIEIIIKEMSDGPGDIVVIVAGYPEEMKVFLDSNPGLKSRFNQTFEFPDYTPQELLEIAKLSAKQRAVQFSPKAKRYLYTQLVEAYRTRDKSFGNARYVISLVEQAKMNLGLRIMNREGVDELSKYELSTVRPDDISGIFDETQARIADLPVDEELLRINLQELSQLIGLEKVKKDIEELVQLVRFYREIGRDPRDEFSLHTIFEGNPGTGKTTVARVLANIYKALGILERGHLIEVDRQKLVAGYLGQTAEKTDKVIDSAKGGVLFIDEAYTLVHGDSDSFGKEAIATLLKRMEDERGEFIVIIAGYPQNMEQFMKSNPGLKSRFDQKLVFADYEPIEMFRIAKSMFKNESMAMNKAAQKYLKTYLKELSAESDKYFGNARTVRKLVERAMKNQHLRLARIDEANRSRHMIQSITLRDIRGFDQSDVMDVTESIGFRRTAGSGSSDT